MISKVLGLVTVAVGLTWAVAGQAADFALAFENTLKVEDANGTTLIYLNEDGTYTTDRTSAGKWEATDSEFCFYPDGQEGICSPLLVTDKGIGESWTSTSSDGASTATFTLVEGR